MLSRFCLVVCLLLVALGSGACTDTIGTVAEDLTGLVAGQPSATEESAAKRFSLGPDSLADGLGALQSYRRSLIVNFEGVKAGQTSAGRIESLVEIDQATTALYHRQSIEATIPNSVNSSRNSEFFRQDNTIYVARDKEKFWFEPLPGQQISPSEVGFYELEKLIVLPEDVSVAPTFEKLNGQNVQHFRFTEADLAHSDIEFSRATGSVWVNIAGNFVTQYAISATVTSLVPVPDAHLLDEGQLSVQYALADINAGFSREPPAGFRQTPDSLTALPRLPDGRLTAAYPTLIEYTSVISPISATLFYRDELSALDWQEENAEIFNEKASLLFSKEADRLKVLITPGSQPETIKVMLDMSKP